ncbi:MAG TPA: TonB-dependent receptor [Bryobacteraceae bacterium]|nr:TonB-dependent receptor [Bryobacteraceae bacterium]
MQRLLGLVIVFGSLILCQTPNAEITGTVTDASGAVITGATVTVTNPQTNSTRSATTNEAGVYSVPALLPGIYNVRVNQSGFSAQVRNDVELQTSQVAKLDFSLQVGNVAETVEVTAGAPVLDTETTSVGTVIENKRIVDLPLNGRNYLQLASLIPGATTNGPASSQGQQRMGGARNSFALNISGQRVHYNHYSLDGMENTDSNFNTYLFLPSIDALQEFKVESGLFSAEYGRAIAQVNVSTKSGTNSFHGTAFEFLRNSYFDAKNYFARGDQPNPPFKRNQFGGTLGGPILRNKLFFLFNYEGLRERKAITLTGQMPPANYRTGDFSFLGRQIRDPQTGQPFAGNIIPANRLDPTSVRVLNEFFPLPNQSTPGGSLANNYLNNETRRTDGNQFTARSDWNINPENNAFFRFSHTEEPQYIPGGNSPVAGVGNNVDILAHQGVLGYTKLFGGNKVNEVRFGMNYFKSANIQTRAFGPNIVADLNIPGVSRDQPLYYGIPVVQISGFSNIGECNDCPFINWNTTLMLNDNFSWNLGKHSLRMGVEYRHLRYNQIGAVVPRGRFSFNGQYSGDPMADYLLGYMSGAEGQLGVPTAGFRNHYWAGYVQDTWKLTPKLTLNLGLRWEYEAPFVDKYDNIVNIDFAWNNSIEPVFVRAGKGDPFENNPQYRLPSDWQYVRDGRFGRGAYRPDRNDWAPRVGVAYQLTPKTVIRSGAGIYYVRDIANATFDIVRNAPFSVRQNETANTTVPNLNWARPFTAANPSFITVNQFDEPTSYVAQWSFGVQRELTRDMSLEVTYLGSAGVHLRRLQTYNNAPPGVGNINDRRPFPKFRGGFQVMNAPSHSSYHALQTRLQHRLNYGFTILASYAYSKSIDNGSGIRTTDGDQLTPTDDYNLNAERGLSAFDFRHRLTTSFLYELPFGRGKAIGIDNGILNALFGGWQLGGIFTFQTGFPLTAFCGPGNIQNGGGQCRPDAIVGKDADLPGDQRQVTRYFNTDAFVDRLGQDPNRITEFRYGTAGRNTIEGPGVVSVDASLNKFFRFTERQNLEFRWEVFNAPNRPNFAPPGTTLRTPTYGVITGTKIDNRQMQLALKYNF